MNQCVGIFNGRPVFLEQPRPRMTVSAEFSRLQSPELVQKTNEWMREFFGFAESLLPDGQVIHDKLADRLVMNHRTYLQLKEAIAKRESQ